LKFNSNTKYYIKTTSIVIVENDVSSHRYLANAEVSQSASAVSLSFESDDYITYITLYNTLYIFFIFINLLVYCLLYIFYPYIYLFIYFLYFILIFIYLFNSFFLIFIYLMLSLFLIFLSYIYFFLIFTLLNS
jgi:hypothetical protein